MPSAQFSAGEGCFLEKGFFSFSGCLAPLTPTLSRGERERREERSFISEQGLLFFFFLLPSPAEKLVAASRRIGRGVGGEGTHNGRSEVKPLYLTTSILSVAWKLLASNR